MANQVPNMTFSLDFEITFKDEDLVIPHENNFLQYVINNDNDLRNNYLLLIAYMELMWEADKYFNDHHLWRFHDNLVLAMVKEISWEDYEEFIFSEARTVFSDSTSEVENRILIKNKNFRFAVDGKELPINYTTPQVNYFREINDKYVIAEVNGVMKVFISK